LTIECQHEQGKVLFAMIAACQEVLQPQQCGCCKSIDTRLSVRNVDGNTFYEHLCNACGAKLAIGQNKDGRGLFTKRTDKDGNQLPDKGWSIYKKPAAQPAAQTNQPASSNEDVPF
jgi:hypothetical protein